ncbi:SDR family oxidoreductase [Streptomyces sp. NEAU-W12]|uniref:SDR family oxidoreductase n=1 Tax=Streptomyces sp. NEAU-W12 TaxID=2994668 RepID=UPI00224A6927|nr:SDR family oxidoreductase [Streptomyces sp. NEAU-W12]MCX2926984.1 SDR family oxidoreductase [Streptomyces sp. NEAU-W12]
MNRLTGRVALVTGGARGIGEAVVRAFADEGASVMITDVLDEAGRALQEETGTATRFCVADVTSESAWASAVAETERTFGPVSLLVNNAGIVEFGSIEETDPAVFRRVLDINLFGPWLGMRAVAPSMRRAGDGVILNVSSTAGLMGYASLGAYVASKWGLRGLTKAAALDLASDNIRVCSIHPGPISTPMTAGMDDSITVSQPIPRFGTPQEVARMAVFLAADATYSTGSEFVIDGGATTGSMILNSEQD